MAIQDAPTRFDAQRFALMFGPAAAERRPELYHLMALTPDGGLDLIIPWESMLAAAPKILRHEDAFGWMGMSRDPCATHCALLDCLMRECCSLARADMPGDGRPASNASWEGRGASGTLMAYALLDPSGNGGARAALEAIGAHAHEVAPGAHALPIPARISHALSQALFSAPGEVRAQIIASAAEAIALNRESALGAQAPRPTRI